MRYRRRLPVLLALLPLLSACGGDALVAARGAAPSPSSLGACPAQPGASPAACTPYDPDALMASNEMYRQRGPAPTSGPELAEQATRIEQSLEALTVATPRPTGRQVLAALVASGFAPASVQASTSSGEIDLPSRSLAIAVDWHGTCLVGELRDGQAKVAPAGGYIADGGCLALEGH